MRPRHRLLLLLLLLLTDLLLLLGQERAVGRVSCCFA
jgi:hypothetical protein